MGAAAAATTLLRGCAANRNDEDGKVGCAVSSARLIIRDKEGGAFAKEVRGEDLRWPWEWQPSVHRPDTDVVGLLARALVSYQPSKEGKEAGEVRLRATVEQLRKEISAASNDMVADMAEVLSGGAKQKALEAIAGSEDAHDEVLQQVVSQMPPCCGAGGTVPGTHIERMMLATQTGGANRIVVLHPTIRAYICRTSSANDLTK